MNEERLNAWKSAPWPSRYGGIAVYEDDEVDEVDVTVVFGTEDADVRVDARANETWQMFMFTRGALGWFASVGAGQGLEAALEHASRLTTTLSTLDTSGIAERDIYHDRVWPTDKGA